MQADGHAAPGEQAVSGDAKRHGMTGYFGGMAWPVPGLDLNDLEWNLRYGAESRTLMLSAASVVSAYRSLLALPRRELNKRVTQIKHAAALPDSRPQGTKPKQGERG